MTDGSKTVLHGSARKGDSSTGTVAIAGREGSGLSTSWETKTRDGNGVNVIIRIDHPPDCCKLLFLRHLNVNQTGL